MATAKKLPSGSWRVQVYSHSKDGKKIRESFTAPTKAEAEMKAAKFSVNRKRRAKHDLTVGEALDGYISAKEGVLSPSTVRGYIKMRNNNFASIEKKRVRNLTSEDVQIFISELSATESPKTVRNVYGLLRPAVAMYAPDMYFRVTMPPKRKSRPESPSDDDIRLLYENASPDMKIRLALATLGLRRGEMCAIKYEDIDGTMLHVHADMVQDKDNKWVYKEMPKTSDSDRYIMLSDKLLALLGTGKGFIINCKPPAVTAGFIRLRNKAGVNKRLHDMRHFFASTAVVLGIPELYTADMGGWDRGGNSAMKTIYQNNIRSKSEHYAAKIASHMDSLLPD